LSLRTNLFGAACALALVSFSAPAFAQFNGVLSGDYSHINVSHGGGNANDYGVSGAGAFGLGANWDVQVDGGYHRLTGGGSDANNWNVGGAAYWSGYSARLGAVVGYDDVTGGGADAHATNYGGFVDWYVADWLTFAVKGGWHNGSVTVDNPVPPPASIKANANGEYGGANMTFYLAPDLSLAGYYDYAHFKNFITENDYTAEAEWLISERMPVSLYAGYTRSAFAGTGGADANTVFVGLRFYCDPVRGASLVARQRGGAEIYGTNFGPAALHL